MIAGLKHEKISKNFIRQFFIAGFLALSATGFLYSSFWNDKPTSNSHAVSTNIYQSEKYFSIAILPDVQYYTAEKHNGKMQMFSNQTNWITTNVEKEKIAYVAQLGDITDHGDAKPIEWERAAQAMYLLEKELPDMPYGIPYGVAVGNHDVRPNGDPNGTKIGYSKYFGRSRFEGRPYYGGAYNDLETNENHYDVFDVNGEGFIVLYLAYNDPARKDFYDAALEEKVYNWGAEVLAKHTNRKAIIVSHSLLRPDTSSKSNFREGVGFAPKQGKFTKQGRRVIEKFKHSPNVFLMLCGHVSGEAVRKVTFEGRTIYTVLTDYQGRRNDPYTEKDRNGGNGIMRLMKFNQETKTIHMRTFIPDDKGGVAEEETDEDSNFSIPYK